MNSGSIRYRWSTALPMTLLLLGILVLAYRDTLMSMIGIWLESDTFSHGFLVFPAVAFLIYRSRARVAALDPRPSWLGFTALLGFLVLWFVADVGSVQVAEQFAFVGALIACVWAILGTSVLRVIAFPLLFAFFAVPFGDFIIPTLMQFTAWFVVEAIQLTGIPVFREGYMLSIPRGDFEVAKACSGIRYLIASVSLGTFYAYITYTSWKKRAAFVALAIIMPIIANGLRAFGIVMIAHFSNLKHAVGVDHLIYGWLFFGILIFMMFWFGGRYADEPIDDGDMKTGRGLSIPMPSLAAVVLAVMASVLVAPALSQRALAAVDAPIAAATLPQPAAGWTLEAPSPAAYSPVFEDANDAKQAVYRRGEQRIGVTLHTYTGGDRELVRAGNRFEMLQGHKTVRQLPLDLTAGEKIWPLGRLDLLERGPRRAVIYWYQIGDVITPSSTTAKIREWLARLSGEPTRRVVISLSMPTDPRDDVPPPLLEFAQAHVASLFGCVSEPAAATCVSPESMP